MPILLYVNRKTTANICKLPFDRRRFREAAPARDEIAEHLRWIDDDGEGIGGAYDRAALAKNISLTFMNHPQGVHGFDN